MNDASKGGLSLALVGALIFTSIVTTIGAALYVGERAVVVSERMVVMEMKLGALGEKIDKHLTEKK